MRKIIFISGLLSLVFGLKASADVCVDSVSSDGTRYLYCSMENISTVDDPDINLMALECVANKKDTTYVLSFMLTSRRFVFYSVPKKGKAYIKDTAGVIDSLTSVSSYEQSFVRGMSVISPKYIISKRALSLIKGGIIKIRLEMSKGYYDIGPEAFNAVALQKQIIEIDRYLKGYNPKVNLLKGF